MFAGIMEIGRNPISLRKPRSLTVDQFRALLSQLHEPFSPVAADPHDQGFG